MPRRCKRAEEAAVATTAVVVCWLGVLRHHALARTALMAICAVEAIGQFAALSASGTPDLPLLLATSASVVILVSASSTATRRWVREARLT